MVYASFRKRILCPFISLLFFVLAGCKSEKDSEAIASPANQAKIVATTPFNASLSEPLNRKITATFNSSMDPESISSLSFKVKTADSEEVSGTVSYEPIGLIAVFTPTAQLAPNRTYQVTITTDAKDQDGLSVESDYVWTFTSGSILDTTAPQIEAIMPADLSTGVARNSGISITFDEVMDPTTFKSSQLIVTGPDSVPIAGTVTYSNTTASFRPKDMLAVNAAYTISLVSGLKDLAGNSVSGTSAWSFTTGSASAAGPLPVELGLANNYVMLAKAAISTTGATAIVGDIGLSPAAQGGLTGFTLTLDSTNTFAKSDFVTGKLFAADMANPTPAKLMLAMAQMEAAYRDAEGRVLPDATELGAGNVSGLNLKPGLYKWGSGLLIASSLTLTGNANDVWIFQIAQGLTVMSGVQIILAGGAQAKNIYWQTAGQVTLGTTSAFKGIILSKTAVVIQTGAEVRGKVYAQTAVTLDAVNVR